MSTGVTAKYPDVKVWPPDKPLTDSGCCMTQRKQHVPSIYVSQRGPGLRENRPWQPTTCQESSRKVSLVIIPILSHNDTMAQHSCLQPAEEALELPQGWLEALLPSYRWIPWETSTSVRTQQTSRMHTKIFARTCYLWVKMYPTWPSQSNYFWME